VMAHKGVQPTDVHPHGRDVPHGSAAHGRANPMGVT